MRTTLFAVLLALPLAGRAATPLTESEAVQAGLNLPDMIDMARGSEQAAQADLLDAGQWSNPTLSYDRERLRGSPSTLEQTWTLSQSFDVSGRQRLQRQAAEKRKVQATLGNHMRRVDTAAEIRRRFHDALYRQETVRLSQTWLQHFARIETLVARLARAGEASGFDRRRLERERQAAEARQAAEQADHELSLARLAALIGREDNPEVAGVLLPSAPPPLPEALARIERRPDLQRLARRAEAADLDGRAAARGVFPEITVGVGMRSVEEGALRDSGPVVTLSVPLPIFQRQQSGRLRAAAEGLQARAEYRLLRKSAETEFAGVWRKALALRTAAAEFRARGATTWPTLLRIAEAAYQGGESSLLELLDAYRGTLEAELTALELEKRARDARIELDLYMGITQ